MIGCVSSSLHMRRLREADPQAIEELYREYHPRLLSFCRHLLGDAEEAEDVVQLTFLAAHVQLPHERIQTSVGAWLFTVARRRCIDVLRRRRQDVPLSGEEASTRGLAAEVERREELRRLVGDLQRLDPTHRSALLLTQLEALPQAEVALVLGTNETRVRRLVFEARQALLARRESRDLACRAIQEELANAHGSQLRRRHLAAHCEQCEECEAYRTALLSQRAALRVVLPAFAVLIPARRAWASSSVPRPSSPPLTRVIEILGRVPSPALGTVVVALTLVVTGGLPSPSSAPAPATQRFEAPSRARETSGTAVTSAPVRISAAGAGPATTVPPPASAAGPREGAPAGPGVAAGRPGGGGEPAATPVQDDPPPVTAPSTPPITAGAPEAPTVTVPAVTAPETPPAVTPPIATPPAPAPAPTPTVPVEPPKEQPPPDRPDCGFEGTPC